MSGFFDKVRKTTGLGLNQNELYTRAFEKGVLLTKFGDAADIFDKAARKFGEQGDQAMATQASANALLYRYLATKDASILGQLMQQLRPLQQIEAIGSQTEMMSVGSLSAELDCRMVEFAISQARGDMSKLRDLHKLVRDKFQAIMRERLLTYGHVASGDGHDNSADMRYFYHNGMYQFHEAMLKKDHEPSAASDDLSLAVQSFRRCNDQSWLQTVNTLLENWRISRTCWVCHREVQGYELHFSMYRAIVTPYTHRLLQTLNQDKSTMSLEHGQLAVCTPCGSMITFKAAEEADKVRQELDSKILVLAGAIDNLNDRVNRLERMAHHH